MTTPTLISAPAVASSAGGGGAERDVAALGRVLGIWSHPDDESYLSGGLMAAAVTNGQPVACITATAGELGTTDPARWPPRRLARTRRRELRRALAVLGVQRHSLLGYTDGALIGVDEQHAVDRLLDLIARERPDTIVTFGPDGFTGHVDHRVISRWVTLAARALRPVRVLHAAKTTGWVDSFSTLHTRFPIFYPGYPLSVEPDGLSLDLCLADADLELKARALRAHATQTEPIIAALGEDRWREWIRRESFVDAPRDMNLRLVAAAEQTSALVAGGTLAG